MNRYINKSISRRLISPSFDKGRKRVVSLMIEWDRARMKFKLRKHL